jgi:hypothetical protein
MLCRTGHLYCCCPMLPGYWLRPQRLRDREHAGSTPQKLFAAIETVFDRTKAYLLFRPPPAGEDCDFSLHAPDPERVHDFLAVSPYQYVKPGREISAFLLLGGRPSEWLRRSRRWQRRCSRPLLADKGQSLCGPRRERLRGDAGAEVPEASGGESGSILVD